MKTYDLRIYRHVWEVSVYPQLKWFVVWRSTSNISSMTITADNVLEVLDEEANDFDDLE